VEVDARLEGSFSNPCAIPRPETYEDWLKYVELSAKRANGVGC
jgi:hypothetical protein